MKFTPSAALLAALAVAGPAAAQSPPASQPMPVYPANSPETLAVVNGVQERLKNTTSVQANFVQEKTLTLLKHKLVIHGRFATQKPGKVIWVVTDPVKYAIRVEGSEIRQWDEDTNKVSVINLAGDPTFKAINEQVQGWFLGDYSKLKDNYDVAVMSESPLSIRFSARGNSVVAKLMKDIQVTFDAGQTNIEKMTIREAGGDVTTLRMTDAKLNQPIPPQAWEIPPK